MSDQKDNDIDQKKREHLATWKNHPLTMDFADDLVNLREDLVLDLGFQSKKLGDKINIPALCASYTAKIDMLNQLLYQYFYRTEEDDEVDQ